MSRYLQSSRKYPGHNPDILFSPSWNVDTLTEDPLAYPRLQRIFRYKIHFDSEQFLQAVFQTEEFEKTYGFPEGNQYIKVASLDLLPPHIRTEDADILDVILAGH